MNHVESMLQAHPNRTNMAPIPGLPAAIVAILDCAQACTTCADACIAEDKTRMLMRCIRVDMDCAAICAATAAMLSRVNEPDWRIIRAQLQACITACAACAEECEKHARDHAHCRVCAETCRTCERACTQAMSKVPTMAAA
jgi:hypothetical protein